MQGSNNHSYSDRASSSSEQKVVYAHDLLGNITFLNHAGELILGYTCEEARRMNVADVMRAEVAAAILGQAASNSHRPFGAVYEIEMTAKDGRRLQLEVSTHVVSRRGRPIEIEGIAVPATSVAWARASRPRCLDEDFCNAI
jgi:PAS domain S-box-containing protein